MLTKYFDINRHQRKYVLINKRLMIEYNEKARDISVSMNKVLGPLMQLNHKKINKNYGVEQQ